MSTHVNDIVFAGEVIKIGRWRLPAAHPRFHDSGPARHYLFVFPRTSTWIQHAGGRPFVADPNIVTYYNVNQEYTRRAIAPAGDWCEYFAVAPQVLREVVAAQDPAAGDEPARILRFSHGPSDAEAYLAQRSIYAYVTRHSTADPFFIEEVIVGVLDRVLGLAYSARPRAPERQADIVEHARELLARNFASRLTLAALAHQTGASVFHLCRLFRAGTGVTMHRYRNRLRLRAALERVLDSGAGLTDVALALGYSSHSHFTSAFREEYGVTPSALRDANRARRMPRSMSSHRRLIAPTPGAPARSPDVTR